MKQPIMALNEFLQTYPIKTQERISLYSKVMELRSKYGYGSKKISRLLNVSRHKVEGWLYQKNMPRPIKALDLLKKLGFEFPLNISRNQKFSIFLKIFAFIFGDGGISRDFRIYLTGKKEDLEELKEEIENAFPLKCKIFEIKPMNTKIGSRLIKGRSFSLDIQGQGSHILGRLLYAAKAPIGDKVITPFLVPHWIMISPTWVKRLFLEVLLGNELQKPSLGYYGCHFGAVQFRMVKIKKYVKHHKKFLNQIRKLLKQFNIQTSSVKQDKDRRDRKDGEISIPMYFRIQKNKLNLLRFYKQFKLFYAQEKQRVFDESAKAIKNSLQNEIEKINLFYQTHELAELGLGCRRIARILGVPEKRSMIDSWLRYSQKPIYINQKEEIERLLNE